MKNSTYRLMMLAAAAFMFAVLAIADKPAIVTIKSGPIKPSSGDEPGTLKGIVHLRLSNPSKGPYAPDPIAMTFDIQTEAKIPKGSYIHLNLKGMGRTSPGRTTEWRIEKQIDGLALFVNNRKVDFVRSTLTADPTHLLVTAYSSPFDSKKHPYGPWSVSFQNGDPAAGKKDPPVVLVPYPVPPSVPVPIPPQGG